MTLRLSTWLCALATLVLAATPLAAQNQPRPGASPSQTAEVAVPPIECWWKTDRNAVRVGEPFGLTLTCAVLDTERVRVVVDESGLGPAALHLTPFEIVDGRRFRDIPNAPRRFFQYHYTIRVLGEEFFGREVTLPRLQISYRVQNSLQGGAALAGREAQYSLVPVPIRVLSLVPPGASEIRDTPIETFGDVEARLFRSNLLLIAAGVALVLAALVAIVAVSRAAVKRRAASVMRRRVVSPLTVLSAASRELAAVRAASRREGWSSELAGRAASALRLAGAVALSRPVSQKEVDRKVQPGEGQVPARPGVRTLRGKKLLLSAAITPSAIAGNGKAADSSSIAHGLSEALGVFTAARYRRPDSVSQRSDSAAGRNGFDEAALDSALAEAQDAVRRLRFSQWRRFPRAKPPTEAAIARQSWAR